MYRSIASRFFSYLASLGVLALTVLPSSSQAFEAFDGRLQAHGFFESQLRFINADFGEQWDMTQWYQVFNLEVELDIAPDGFGPFDLLQAYVRAEVRFDCIYTHGCGMFQSVNAFGDKAKSLPRRLSNAEVQLAAGQFKRDETYTNNNGNFRPQFQTGLRLSGADRDPVGWSELAGFRGLLQVAGADGQTGNPLGVPWAGGASSQERDIGRCRNNRVQCNYLAGGSRTMNGEGNYSDPTQADFNQFKDPAIYADFYTGGEAEVLRNDDPAVSIVDGFKDFRFTQVNVRGGGGSGMAVSIMGPWLPKNFVHPNAAMANRLNPFDNYRNPDATACPPDSPGCSGFYAPTEVSISLEKLGSGNYVARYPEWETDQAGNVIPCGPPNDCGDYEYNPNGAPVTSAVQQAANFNSQLTNNIAMQIKVVNYNEWLGGVASRPSDTGLCGGAGQACDGQDGRPTAFQVARHMAAAESARLGQRLVYAGTSTGGKAYRPIPVEDAGQRFQARGGARGIYYPSRGLVQALDAGKINYYPFNCSETDRMWNRCDSQEQTKELKEAYFDIETLDSRLWLRVGKQFIVWGKTELFRTTDQFNPLDYSIATLGSLEETRIGLWAFRGVYSLYEVGPLQDVRIEAAFNFDEFKPNDLGNCGEPYTVNLVCNLTFGAMAHGAAGIGVAGLDRPQSPWESIKGWEGGARIEFRWDKFSFAISDYYGFNDFPSIKRISTYERNVDPSTGRPRAYGTRGRCDVPDGAANPYWQNDDCLRAGPANRLQLLNDGQNQGFNGQTALLDPTQFVNPLEILKPDGSPEFPVCVGKPIAGGGVTPPVPGNPSNCIMPDYLAAMEPANNVPLYLNNQVFTADPNDPRHQYADPSNPLYQGEKFRAGMPTCDGTLAPDQCVAPLYAPQFDPQNTAGTPGVAAEDEFRNETVYSENNALEGSPLNQSFFALVCVATVGFSALDPTACATTLFGSSAAIPGGPTPLNAVFGKLFGGFPSLGTLAGGALAGTTPPLTANWHDYLTLNTPGFGSYNQVGGSVVRPSREMEYDAVAGCFDKNAANSSGKPTGRRCDWDDYSEFRAINNNGGFQGNYNPRIAHETLNAVLAPEQEALLGCGPFFGTNCDQSGVDFLWFEGSAVLQSFPGIEGTTDLPGQGWRTDGLGAGEKVMVLGGLSKVDICGAVTDPVRKPNGPACEGTEGVAPIENPLVTQFNSAYQGLTLDQIQLLFQDFLPNCSTWLGRVNQGEDCVKRYAQPGTIGSRDIGLGSLQAAGVNVSGNGGAYTELQPNNLNNSSADFVGDGSKDQMVFQPGDDFQNFQKRTGARCTTTTFGGAEGQILPGCRNKWANYQDEMIKVTETINGKEWSAMRANLNLFGRDRYCQENWVFLGTGGGFVSPEVGSTCLTFSDGTPLAPGTFLGGVYSPRDDLRSWDATKDGDPDYLGFDNLRTLNASGEDYLHPAVAFRAEVAAGTNPALPGTGGAAAAPFVNGGNRCTPAQFLPLDAGGSNDTLRAQCSRFVRKTDGTVDPNQLVLAKGTGHPLTGQAWANEMAGVSWNFFQLLVGASAEYQENKIPKPNNTQAFPQLYNQPLSFAAFNPNDPSNDARIAQIKANEVASCTPTEGGYRCPPAIKKQNDELRANMKAICSFVTVKGCGTVGAVFGIAGQGAPTIKAGGNGTFGRRTTGWAGGGEILLEYEKRNVLGFGADFAEDYTKTNWGLEWTWIPDVVVGDADSMSNVSRVNTYNLTLSMDRPTFINFLSSNRTFFITTQWFFQYIEGFKKSMGPRGPYNILGTLFIQTGYFQDRLLPQLILVYDVKSVSGAAIPQVTYRYSDAFSISFGVALFMGREFLVDMQNNGIGPPGNRLGDNAYKNSTPAGLGIVRDRDEVFFKLRYTF